MAYIPKKVQRLQKSYAEMVAGQITKQKEFEDFRAVNLPPRVLDLKKTPNQILRAVDVYLNGELQTTCAHVDADQRFVMRWPKGRKDLPDRSKPLNTVIGDVQIRWKGQPL